MGTGRRAGSISLIFCMIFLSIPVFSQAEKKVANETVIDEEFKWLKEETLVMTDIATKTSMDADLVPGMVTVLFGEKLEAKGIRTVYEALSLVPGLNVSRINVGYERVSVRGVGSGFFSGNLKILLNGVALNDTLSAAGYVIYNIPTEQIERIEIIRGPGSVIYGEYAYAGVVSVTTRKEMNRVYGSYSSNRISDNADGGYDRYSGGGIFSYTDAQKDLYFHMNLAGWEADRSDTQSGRDRLHTMGIENSGPVNDAQQSGLMNLNVGYKDFSLSGQYALNGRGDYYGFLWFLPREQDEIVQTHEHWGLEAKQKLRVSEKLNMEFKGGWRRYKNDLTETVGIPAGLVGIYDSLGGSRYEEREVYGGAEMISENDFVLKNTFLLGLKYSDVQMEEVWTDTNMGGRLPEMMRLRGEDSWILEDQERKIFSLYAEDMFDIVKNLTVTLGFRYDDYDDQGGFFSPRGAAVWQMAENHILKTQYAESFRPPTFTEFYSQSNGVAAGNPDLDAEHIRTIELGYIFRKPETVFRSTLFWSQLQDNIEHPATSSEASDPDDIRYVNGGDIDMKGFELEIEQQLGAMLRLEASLSYSDTEDEDTGRPVEGSAEWLGNVNLTAQPRKDCTVSLLYQYMGERARGPLDKREDLDADHTLDLAVSFHNLLTKRFGLRAAVKNIFDTEVYYPAPADTYPDDFPRPGREYWVQLSHTF